MKLALEIAAAILLAGIALVMVALPATSAGTSANELQQMREANATLLNDYRTATDEKARLYLENDRLRQLLRQAGIDYTPEKTE